MFSVARIVVLLLPFLGSPVLASGQEAPQVRVDTAEVDLDVPRIVLEGVPFTANVTGLSSPAGNESGIPSDSLWLRVGDDLYRVPAEEGPATTIPDLRISGGADRVAVTVGGRAPDAATAASARPRILPGWISLIPPLLAIGFALVFRQVIPALFAGIWSGAWIIAGGTDGAVRGLLDTVAVYVVEAMANPDHVAIIVFSLMIGGMVGIISRGGGMQGVVDHVLRFARNARSGQLATSFLGVAIFFDDYANTLIVGNTMRAITDRLRISREKLAYLVDSTAAPIACLAFVTTWIGYEVGLIGEAVAELQGFDQGAYAVFLSALPYNFYPILALFFVFAVVLTGRDFGPMYRAERRARTTGAVRSPDAEVAEDDESRALTPKSGVPHRAVNAVVPVAVLVVGVMIGLYVTGEGETLRAVIGTADAYLALLWGSMAGVGAGFVLVLAQGILALDEALDAWLDGVETMLLAMVILILAWALSDQTEILHTADYLVSALGTSIPPALVPAAIAVLAALTAFSTGSSWGTMAILMPLVIPLTWSVLELNEMASDPRHLHILYSSVAVVLAGAVWGDHCSPISDTTILSSMASGCDHIAHVRTQLPYALLVGGVALLLGTVPAGYGLPWWVCLPLGTGVLWTVLRTVGVPTGDRTSSAAGPEE